MQLLLVTKKGNFWTIAAKSQMLARKRIIADTLTPVLPWPPEMDYNIRRSYVDGRILCYEQV